MFRRVCLQQTRRNKHWICPSHQKQPNQDKTDKVYETSFSGKQQAIKDGGSERGASNEVGPAAVPAHGLERVPRVQSKQRDGRQVEPGRLPEPGRRSPRHTARPSAPGVAGEKQTETTGEDRDALTRHTRAL